MAVFKKVIDVVTGVPSLEQAQARLEQSQQAVVAASQALDACKVAKMAADESGEADKIVAAESAEIAADRVLERAVRQEQIHQRHYRRALEARQAEQHAEGRKALGKASAGHVEAANAAGRAIRDLAQAVKALDASTETLFALSQQKIASPYAVPGSSFGNGPTRNRIRIDLERAGVFPGPYIDESIDTIERWAEKLAALMAHVDAPVADEGQAAA